MTNGTRTKLLAQAAVLTALLSAPVAGAAPPCDRVRAVEPVKAAALRDKLDLKDLQLVVEGPYRRAKFVRTHLAFPLDAAAKRKLGKKSFYFVWFHPPFSRTFGARGADLWGLVGTSRCELLHLARER